MRAGRFQGAGPPQNAPGAVAPQTGEHEAVVNADILKSAVYPGWHRQDIALTDISGLHTRVESPLHLPVALEANKDFGGEVHVGRVGLAVRHGYAADLKAMLFAQAHGLFWIL